MQNNRKKIMPIFLHYIIWFMLGIRIYWYDNSEDPLNFVKSFTFYCSHKKSKQYLNLYQFNIMKQNTRKIREILSVLKWKTILYCERIRNFWYLTNGRNYNSMIKIFGRKLQVGKKRKCFIVLWRIKSNY